MRREVITRLKSDSFGICIECEEPISGKRLIAKPESVLFRLSGQNGRRSGFRKKH